MTGRDSRLSNIERWTIRKSPAALRTVLESGTFDGVIDGPEQREPVSVVRADAYQAAVEEHRAFVAGLTEALDAHGVPAMPSWREAIDWLAAHAGQ